VQKKGGWSSAKMLLDVYAHFLPREMRGFSNTLGYGDGTTRNRAVASGSDAS